MIFSNPPGISRTPWAAEPWLCSQKGTVAPRSRRAKLATGDNLELGSEKHRNTILLYIFYCNFRIFQIFQMENEKIEKTNSVRWNILWENSWLATQSKHAVRCCRGTQLCRCNQVHLNLAMLHRGTRDQFMVICGAGQCQFPSSSTTYPSGRPSAKNANGRSRNRKKCTMFFVPHGLRSCRKYKPGRSRKIGTLAPSIDTSAWDPIV